MPFPRHSGVLLHPTSLPGPRGSGDLGPAAAFSLVYFLAVLLISWVFYTVMATQRGGPWGGV